MTLTRRRFAALAGAACLAGGQSRAQEARAQPRDEVVRLGVLTDMTGIFADLTGNGSVEAARMAVERFGGSVGGRRIEVVSADHQNKADVASAILRKWYDQDGVDAVFDFANSACALAAVPITRERNKVMIPSGVGTTDLTGPQCSPNTIHWTWDSYGNANALVKGVLAQGGKRWFFITVDYAFGTSLETTISALVRAQGGTVAGAVRHPLGAPDFSSYLLTAQASGADVIVLANGGVDLSNAVKQAREFDITTSRYRIVAPQFNLAVAHAAGLANTQGMLAVGSMNWTDTDTTRSFATALARRNNGIHPDALQAGVYSSVLFYLQAVREVGSAKDGRALVDYLKSIPIDDPLLGKGRVRADGRFVHPVQLYRIKTPAESTGPWDLFQTISTIPGDEAFRPLDQGGCPLVRA
ncbi:ABC transporter substrate-binding protein (plasmid) [Methylobacterium currus]|uniref:ABC transporter substrate-binding protein n=1 Tax=Methylobacterium currus TaxID=2051553 RepID=UPI001E4768B4|nr:ABC transporter substrate-binding protein [Methylobacterium currus]UHC19860.1 ABC transporter substrate-binding protein [Methylobacterium currus]